MAVIKMLMFIFQLLNTFPVPFRFVPFKKSLRRFAKFIAQIEEDGE